MSDAVTAVELESDLVVVRVLLERFGEEHLRRFQADIRAAADAHSNLPFVIDMSRVDYMPSLSLGALVRLMTEFRSRSQALVLAGLQPQVREILVLTRLDRLFELHADVAEAARSLRPV